MLSIVKRAARPVLLTAIILLPAAASLSACNTTAGAGKDISNTGQAIENSAEKNK